MRRPNARGVLPGEPGRLAVPKLHCKGCGEPVPLGRRCWCGEACIEQHMIRNNPAHARRRVLERDKGVCAACGRDCEALRRRLLRFAKTLFDIGGMNGDAKVRQHRRYERIRRWLRRFKISLGASLWQADHIVPVVEGGGGCGLENLRTLCTCCHKRETRELARRRAAERRAQQEFKLATMTTASLMQPQGEGT